MLNPESVVWRRVSGVRPRRSLTGFVTGTNLQDDRLLFTGGGHTELLLDLLFDISIPGTNIPTEDVRHLTAPLWALAENVGTKNTSGRPPAVRFLWGKSWNLVGVITSVAERLEHFTMAGTPRRSWLRLRFVRVDEDQILPTVSRRPVDWAALTQPPGPDTVQIEELLGGGASTADAEADRLDQLASRYYGDATLWRLLAEFNDVDNPTRLAAGTRLRIPLV